MRLSPVLVPISLAVTGAVLLGAKPASAPAAPSPTTSTADVYVVDNVHSFVLFSIGHGGVGRAYGRFNEFKGRIELSDDAAMSSVTFELKTGSVDTGNEGRDRHIRSADFLNAGEFPVAIFMSKQVIQDGDVYSVTGDLTLHGVTKEVKLDMELGGIGEVRGKTTAGFHGELEFERADFGMGGMLGMLSNEMTIIISVEAQLQ